MSESQSVEEQENDAVKLFVYLHSDIVNEVAEDNICARTAKNRPNDSFWGMESEQWCEEGNAEFPLLKKKKMNLFNLLNRSPPYGDTFNGFCTYLIVGIWVSLVMARTAMAKKTAVLFYVDN